MYTAAMSCLLPAGLNSAYQHGNDLTLVSQHFSDLSHARLHRRFPSDATSSLNINKPLSFGQHCNGTCDQDRSKYVSHVAEDDEATNVSSGIAKGHLIKIEKSKSVEILLNDKRSSQSSFASLHLPFEPRVPLVLRAISDPSSTYLHHLDHEKAMPDILGVAGPAAMDDSQIFASGQKEQLDVPELPRSPEPKSPSLLSPGPESQLSSRSENVSRFHFDKEWIKIEGLRMNIWSLRSTVRERRATLRQRQLARADAGDRYIQWIRAHNARSKACSPLASNEKAGDTSRDLEVMEDLFNEFQTASDEYGPLEDDCNLLEETLSAEEYELQKLEKKFYDKSPLDFPSGADEVPRQISNSSVYSGSGLVQEHHPLVTEYLSKVGYVEILKERLEYHEDEKFNLEEEQATKRIANWDLASDDQEFLDTFEATKTEIISEIAREQEEAENLKRRCLEQRLIEEDGTPKEFQTREQETFDNEAELDVGSETSEFVKYPILIPEPGSPILQVDVPSSVQEEPSYDSSFMVNKWLYAQLRMAPLEVNLLEGVYELHYGNIQEREKWQRDVLRLWFSDESSIQRPGPLTSSGVLTKTAREAVHIPSLSSRVQEQEIKDTPGNRGILDKEQEMESVGSADDDTIFVAPRPKQLATSDEPDQPDIQFDDQFLKQMADWI